VVLEGNHAEFVSTANKDLPRITWLDAKDERLVQMKVMMVDGEVLEGMGEPNLRELPLPSVVQMERFGFVSLSKRDPYGGIMAFYTHK
jgi:hypothetical protein